MKKLMFIGLMLTSMQAYAFPNLMDYEAPKQICWNKTHTQQFMMFEDDINSVKMNYVTSDNLEGYVGTCPITGAVVLITRFHDKTHVFLKEKGKDRVDAETIQYLDDGFLAYYEGGYIVLFDLDDVPHFAWAQYVK